MFGRVACCRVGAYVTDREVCIFLWHDALLIFVLDHGVRISTVLALAVLKIVKYVLAVIVLFFATLNIRTVFNVKLDTVQNLNQLSLFCRLWTILLSCLVSSKSFKAESLKFFNQATLLKAEVVVFICCDTLDATARKAGS